MEPVQIVGGPRTRASIQRANLTDNPQVEFAYPKIVCTVRTNSIIVAGMVLLLAGDGYYLAAQHSATAAYRVYHLFRCDRQVAWTRQVVSTDLLTGLTKASTGEPQPLGTLWVMGERVRRQFKDSAMSFSAGNTLVATGADVRLGDFLDGQIVKRRSLALGVNIVELQA